MDIQKRLLKEINELEEELNVEKTRCKAPGNTKDTPIELLKFLSYGNALVFFRRLRERNLKIKTLRNSFKVCT